MWEHSDILTRNGAQHTLLSPNRAGNESHAYAHRHHTQRHRQTQSIVLRSSVLFASLFLAAEMPNPEAFVIESNEDCRNRIV